jgi:hypothetical protein
LLLFRDLGSAPGAALMRPGQQLAGMRPCRPLRLGGGLLG